ncbi:MAG: hypothetical protein HC911_03050 [Chloroflexaceae bacterium]|nr:hypothetical protein [Chloroflexaceae bacterium]
MPEAPTSPPNPEGEDRLLRRQQHAAERIQEDESLTADLTDTQASPVLRWAEQQATLIAADPSRSDAEVDAMLDLLRRAIKRAGYDASGDDPAEAILAATRRELQTLLEAFAAAPPEPLAPAPRALPPPPPPFNPPAPPPFNPPQPARLGSVPPPPPSFSPPVPPASERLPLPAPEPPPSAAPAAPEPPDADAEDNDSPPPPPPFTPPSRSSS